MHISHVFLLGTALPSLEMFVRYAEVGQTDSDFYSRDV